MTEEGYEVEMAIPFSSLRFTDGAGAKTWGIDALRVRPRDQRTRIGLNPLPRGRNCYLCHASKLRGFAGVSPGRNLEIAPTVTANDTAVRSGGGERFVEDDEQEAGVTVRWGVTPGTTLSGTVNPDFSQVEADAAQLAVNTQFALFFPEKRPFFLEGGDLFDTRINAVYTRTIADPAWGLKLAGKQGKSGYGVIVAEDERTNLVIPGSQGSSFASLEQDNLSSVVRYRRDLSGEGSALGGIVTSRSGDGYHNHLAGMDALFRWNGGDALRLELLGSDTTYPEEIRGIAGQDGPEAIQGTPPGSPSSASGRAGWRWASTTTCRRTSGPTWGSSRRRATGPASAWRRSTGTARRTDAGGTGSPPVPRPPGPTIRTGSRCRTRSPRTSRSAVRASRS